MTCNPQSSALRSVVRRFGIADTGGSGLMIFPQLCTRTAPRNGTKTVNYTETVTSPRLLGSTAH